MPLEFPAVNAINAVWFVPEGAPWRARLRDLWREHGVTDAVADGWIATLGRRATGSLNWTQELAGGVLPNGRPCPPVRRYQELLAADRSGPSATTLPLLRMPPLMVGFDVWGPGERSGEPGTLGLEMLVHRDVIRPWRAGAVLADGTVVEVGRPDHYARLAAYGDAFADLMARGCEMLEPVFALADGLQPLGDFLAKARPESVRHAAPVGARLADYAWALAYWAPERVDDALRQRLAGLRLPDRPVGAWPDGADLAVRTLSTGGVFLRARRILGGETRGDRVAVETPLAQGLGLRSNHLLFRA